MNAQDIARAVIKLSGLQLSEIADKCGKANAANIGMYLQSKSMRADNLQMILNACGYDLVAKSRDATKPDYIIGSNNEVPAQSAYSDDRIREIVKGMVEEELERRERERSSGLKIQFADELPEDI